MIGETISHYKILEKIGEGGMGIVYKAEDMKLKRIVALKFLPSNALGTEEEKARFIREAQAAASLNHPNIATIYEIDEVEGEIFIAMEYIDGQTLKEKINSGPLKIKEAVKIACQVADGLNAAHEKGITHRDIKSANVMLTEKGQAKIMDFGLAKMAARTGLTKEGTTLGTIAYMSPEQSRGEHVDHRSDIWSLGVVLYEMVSGQLPFKGEYETAMVYSILSVDPEPLTALRTGVPIALDGIAAKAMAKEPDARYQHVDELPVDLKAIDLKSIDTSKILTTTITEKTVPQPSRWRRAVPWKIVVPMLVVSTIITAVAVWFITKQGPPAPKHVKEFAINFPVNIRLVNQGLAISPDGTQLVYVANDGDSRKLYLRNMDQLDAVPLSGTDGAANPFFSPDGRWVGFHAGGRLKKVLLTGGNPVIICEVGTDWGGAAWGNEDNIILGSEGSGLMIVSASGGTPQPLTTPDGATTHRWPEILPGGKGVLFTIWPSRLHSTSFFKNARIAVFSFETKDWQSLLKGGSSAHYASTGHIVYARIGGLMAVPFDISNLIVTDSPVPIIDNVVISILGFANFNISGEGSLVYIRGSASTADRTLVWVDRSGNATPLTKEQNRYSTPRISPDGRQVALAITDDEELISIWVYNIESSTLSQLTFHNNSTREPVWDPEGKRVAYRYSKDGTYNICWKPADGSGEEMLLLKRDQFTSAASWSPDGESFAFYEINPMTSRDICILSIKDDSTSVFVATDANQTSPVFSPDGEWIVYTSNETGRYEVFVQPYPVTGAKYRISNDGGIGPVWAPDGRELFYLNGDKMMVVAIETRPVFKQGTPQLLFEGRYLSSTYRAGYDIHPDGERFLMIKTEGESTTVNRINVVLNWFEELKSLFNTGNKR